MTDRRLQVFHAVARYGSFTRAAERLFMTQPAVTFQIRQLEERLNTRLIDRGHGKTLLTPAGELVLAYAEKILALNGEMEARVAELAQSLSGLLAIGTSTTLAAYWLPRLLVEFKRTYPAVITRVFVGNSQLIERRVLERELDLGMIEIATDEPGLERLCVGYDELNVIVAPTHPLAGFSTLCARDLAEHPFITRDPGNAIRILAEQFFEQAHIDPEDTQITAELGSLAAVKEMAAQGLGFAIASKAAIQRDLGEGRLRGIPLSPALHTPLELIFPKERFRSRLITTFVEHASKALREMGATPALS
jgi:DNA-binding transcriptional LysR family regulator